MGSNGTDKLVPYIRQSRYKERTISLDDQRRAIEGWASSNGVALADEIVEQGVSGSKRWQDRELGDAIEACRRGEVDGIIVAFQDRLSRENGVATAEVYETLQLAQARLVAVDGIDTGQGDPEMLFTIKAAIARDQWKRHRTNWANGRRAAIEDRGVHIGVAPAGYTSPVIGTDPKTNRPIHGPLERNEHSNAVRQAFVLRAKGTSWSKVAQHLSDHEVVTSKGSTRWSIPGVKSLLSNEAYLGVARSGDFRKEDAHPAIVDRPLWLRVQATFKEGTVTKRQERSPLNKIVRCASCGNAMALDHNDRGGFYRCRNRGACESKPTISKNLVEQYVLEQVVERTASVDLVERPVDVVELEQSLEAADVELNAWLDNVSVAEIGAELYKRGLDTRKQAFFEAQRSLAEAIPTEGQTIPVGASVEQLLALPAKVQRALIGQVFEQITVARGSGLERVAFVER
jgi:DNA invertase Pin-like site-specific DNA recombinase